MEEKFALYENIGNKTIMPDLAVFLFVIAGFIGLLLVVVSSDRGGRISKPWLSGQAAEKGRVGEISVSAEISRNFPDQDYRLIDNLTLPLGQGTTQIDHVLISRFGIFVIETKHLSGWIFGQPWQKQWTQVLFRQKHRFANPIKQNAVHLDALRRLLPLPHRCFFSVVVFSADAQFKTDMPESVIYLDELVDLIEAKGKTLLRADQIAPLAEQIEAACLPRGAETDRQHIEYVRGKRPRA